MRDQLKSIECARYLKAVAEPERLKIIQSLRGGPRSVGEIAREVGSAISNVSHHLKQLRAAGLVSSRKKGRFVHYELDSRVDAAGSQKPLQVLDFGCCRLELGKK